MRRMPSGNVLQHKFALNPTSNIPRSKFDRSFTHKTTFSAGFLTPILCDEMLPGDTFNLSMNAIVRLFTPLYPVMDNMYVETFFFFVPNRLLWEHWENFFGAKPNPDDTTDYLVPTITAPAVGGIPQLTLFDYMGIPTKVPNLEFNALHARAYNFIWNEWFRAAQLQDQVPFNTGDGPDDIADYSLLRINKYHDYFTSCLPAPQAGPDVVLPLGSQAPIIRDATSTNYSIIRDASDGNLYSGPLVGQPGTGALYDNVDDQLMLDLNDTHYTDLSDATAATINDIRLAFQTQKLYERDMRGGQRYVELVLSHFQTVIPDYRAQRPEFLGGKRTPVIIQPVAQTSSTSGSNALGDLAATGVAYPTNNGFTYSAVESGVILGLIAVRADLNYQQGLERMWSRQGRFDFYWPVFSHLGEQAVLNQEIYAQDPSVTSGTPPTSVNTQVFGYQERYAEYRYKPNLVTGLYRSNATGTLDAWHLAQDFESLPQLSEDFVEEDAPFARINAVSTEPDFKADIFFKYICARPMPVRSAPGLIDHF